MKIQIVKPFGLQHIPDNSPRKSDPEVWFYSYNGKNSENIHCMKRNQKTVNIYFYKVMM